MNHLKQLELIRDYENEIIEIRRTLHKYPEIGFELENTKKIVFDALKNMGYI